MPEGEILFLGGALAVVSLLAWRARKQHLQSKLALSHLTESSAALQKKVQELSADKSQVAAILSNMVEAVVAVGMDGRILAANPALVQMFGLSSDELHGRPFIEVLRHNQLNGLVRSVLETSEGRVEEVRTFSPAEQVFEAHAVPLKHGDQSAGALLVLHNITRLRQLEQVRRDFVANVSHELRTPLASIKGFAETLRLGAVDDREHRDDFLKSIEDHAEQMARLTDDLLDLAAIESGKRVVQKENVSLRDIARDVVKNLQPLADRRHISLSVGECPSGPVFADRIQLRQVLVNLVDNGIKFNREYGRVDIVFSDENDEIAVSVNDTGAGIPSEDLPRVFERFFRVDKARARSMGGTGLGLAIVKHIIESHGGRVLVHSIEGQGSSFSFYLPRR